MKKEIQIIDTKMEVKNTLEKFNGENGVIEAFENRLIEYTQLPGINSFSLLVRELPFYSSLWVRMYSRVEEDGSISFAMKKTLLGKLFFRKGQLERQFESAVKQIEMELSL